MSLKPGFYYPSWRPELTARVDGWPVSITRQHGPWIWIWIWMHKNARCGNAPVTPIWWTGARNSSQNLHACFGVSVLCVGPSSLAIVLPYPFSPSSQNPRSASWHIHTEYRSLSSLTRCRFQISTSRENYVVHVCRPHTASATADKTTADAWLITKSKFRACAKLNWRNPEIFLKSLFTNSLRVSMFFET